MKPIYALMLCFLIAGPAAPAGRNPSKASITKEKAVEIARQFLRREGLASRYVLDSPHVSVRGDEYHVEFRDRRQYVKPGVCIIAVHSGTGAARHIPVE